MSKKPLWERNPMDDRIFLDEDAIKSLKKTNAKTVGAILAGIDTLVEATLPALKFDEPPRCNYSVWLELLQKPTPDHDDTFPALEFSVEVGVGFEQVMEHESDDDDDASKELHAGVLHAQLIVPLDAEGVFKHTDERAIFNVGYKKDGDFFFLEIDVYDDALAYAIRPITWCEDCEVVHPPRRDEFEEDDERDDFERIVSHIVEDGEMDDRNFLSDAAAVRCAQFVNWLIEVVEETAESWSRGSHGNENQ